MSAKLSNKIAEYLNQEEHYRLKPSEGFALFCQVYRDETIQEVKRLRRDDAEAEHDDNEKNNQALLKIKKAFKNKHFMKKKSF
jgi:hypothetical protein